MKGYEITFFAVQNHRHKGNPVGDWLVHLAQEMGLQGATLVADAKGFGLHRRIHSAHFFEMADQPIEVKVVANAEETERLFERLRAEGIRLFYVKSPVEFGTLGDAAS